MKSRRKLTKIFKKGSFCLLFSALYFKYLWICVAIWEKVHQVGRSNFAVHPKNQSFLKMSFVFSTLLSTVSWSIFALMGYFFWQNICENVLYSPFFSACYTFIEESFMDHESKFEYLQIFFKNWNTYGLYWPRKSWSIVFKIQFRIRWSDSVSFWSGPSITPYRFSWN